MNTLYGNPVSEGIAVGKVLIYRAYTPKTGERVYSTDATERLELYRSAVITAENELIALSDRLRAEGSDRADIILAQRELLKDVEVQKEVESELKNTQPDVAVDLIYRKYAAIMAQIPDSIISERAHDFLDLNARLLRILEGGVYTDLSYLEESCIVVTDDLMPSDTAGIDRKRVLGIITQTGGENSHTAIVARSYGIPAILGVNGIVDILSDGDIAIMDARRANGGKVILFADDKTRKSYESEAQACVLEQQKTKEYLTKDGITADGERIGVMLNISSGSDDELGFAPYADGVGLFRTEFLYLNGSSPPTEEKQFLVYKRVLEAFGEKPVILRTMDIGGDKQLPYLNLPPEQNPFLGNRALRLCLSHPDIFRTQLRAALRASVYGNLWLMFPMVTNMEDIHAVKEYVIAVQSELTAEGITVADVKLGVMIEVPSIALIADIVAKEMDFVSIGTNDLCQYLMAADRMNPDVSKYYQSYHPALIRLLNTVLAEFEAYGKPVGICGELGGDPRATELLVGLGFKKLSMGAESLAPVKKRLSEITLPKANALASKALKTGSANEILELLD